MDGENEKGKRAGRGREKGEGQADENMRVRARVSEEGGGKREEGREKPMEKYA